MGGMTGAKVLTATVLIAVHMGMIGGANTWYVDSSFTGGSQAGTPANPCVSLSCALSLSTLSDGDRISVAAGGPDYTGAANSQLTTSKSGISIFGAGLPSKVVLRSTESDVRAFTISSGSIVLLQNMTIRDFNLHSTTLGAGVYVGLKTNLTLLNVDMFNNSASQGGAVSVIEDSVVKMVNCQFVGNTALTGGGAASVDKASLEATSSSFSFNVAKGNPAAQIFGDGGAILYYGESQNYLRLVSGTFSNNTAAEAGGAIHVTSVSTLRNSFSVYETTFEYNSVTGIGRCTSSTLCNVRGGAIYSSVPSSLLQNAVFIGNEASTDAVNQVAEGGAIFSTSVYEDDRQGLVTNIKGAKFSNNYASGCGGAAYLLNQVIIVDSSDFLGNTAGIKTNLFSDTSSNGGALWYSAPYSSQSSIKGTNFTDNFVWGGWGGAIFATDSPLQVLIEECQFTANKAFSSYTFLAQGGAIMISHNSIANLYRNMFVNNTASPRSDVDTTKGPFTLSGAGGAIYVHSANITTTECQFFRNFALTGQFDSGSSGGALLIEDSSYSVVEKCVFQNNAAVGYLGYSSYASSGAAGAVVLKFSSALISNSNFSENWVSVGGTQLSTGGAVAVFFDYNGNDESEQNAGVSIENSIFYDNTAYGQLCTANSPKAGQGGAVAIVGSSLPGVKMTGVSFLSNAAVSRTGFVLSFGGAVSVSVASNVTGVDCLFDQNMALYGLGNDISALEGESVLASRLNFKDSRFSAASSTQVINNRKRLSLKEKLLCSAVTRIIANIIPTDDDDPDRRRRRALSDNHKAYDPLPDWLRELQEKELLSEQQYQQQREKNPRALGLLRTGEGVGQAIKAAMMSTPHATIDSDDTLPAFYHYPSVLITSGSARLINPVFEGNYHVFLGDLLSVLLSGVPSASTSTSSSSATTSCSASIYGNVIQQSLTLTVFQSTLTLASFYEKSVSLKKMTLINGTLNVANNITVGGNSSFISSTISGKLDLSQLSGPIPAFLKSNYHPLIKFKGDLFTGFNLAEVKTLQNLNPAAAVILLGLRPIINVDSCTLKLYKSFDINTPHRTRESPVSEPLSLYMTNNALVNVTSGATMLIKTTTFVMSSTSTSPAIVNFGTIILDGTYAKSIDQKGDDDIPSPGGDDDGKNNDGGRNQRTVSSLDNTLNVDGAFEQAPTGKLILTLNSTGQTRPVLTLVSNATFFGTIVVKFLDEPNVILYNGVPSSWELISYSQASASSVSNTNKPAMLVAPPGVGLYKKSLKTKAWTDTYVLDALACSDVLSYSAGIKENSNNLFPCYLCLSNSSCSFCNNGQCMDSSAQCGGTAGGVQYESSCCKDNCNTPNGRCLASEDNTEFTCECTPFYTGDTCKNLSNISIVLITLAGALVVVIGILFYSYRSTMGKKTQVLEELRQGLLYDQQHMDHRSSTTAINEAYIQSLQQGLILKDVSVKWQEINIEKQVGEGSFGVVFKATFRGASVAVKKMRPLFSELSPKDIEEFNKEAYMMSRLRHPNIVLVMGISFVDQDIIPMPPRRTSIADHREGGGGGGGGDGDDGGFSGGNPLEKKVLPKAVAIVTEFLEQGSLADILYGPHRLPAEIWTYDLILTCALQAARGMLYLHTHSPPICHRDLKSSNLVVDDHWVVKVTDFGMSRILPEKIRDPLLEGKGPAPSDVASTASAAALLSAAANAGGRGGGGDNDSHNSYGSINSAHSTTSIRNLDGSLRSQTGGTTAGPEMTSNLGTTAWCAPELLTSSSTTRYSIKVDVYSFGMVLWEMWEKKRPYEELHSRFDIMDAVRSGRRPLISDSCPPAYKSLLQRCWQAEPGRRPNFQYIVRYLKDELARVKRQRERQLSTSASETPYSYFGSGFGRGPGQASPTNTSSKFSQLLPWNRPAASIEDGVGIGTYAPPNQPQPVPSSRASLAAVNDHNLAYLAASPAVTSPIMMQQQQQQMQQQMQMQQQQQQQQQMQARMSNVGTTASSPRAGPPNQWRDKYVMKFSGWRASQPDTGLPPSAMSAAPTSSTPFPPQGTGVGIEHGQHHAGSISEFAASAAVATRSIQVQPPGRLSNNAVLLEDQVGIFNLDQEHGSTGSYSPPVVVGDTMIGIGLEGNSPIVRVSNSGSGSGRWSRDPDQFQQQHQPQTRADRNSKSSSF